MAKPAVRIGVRTRLIYDGETADVIELQPTKAGVELALRIGADGHRVLRIAFRELRDGGCARIIDDDVGANDPSDAA